MDNLKKTYDEFPKELINMEFEEFIIPIIEKQEDSEIYTCCQCGESYQYTCNSDPRKDGEVCFQCEVKNNNTNQKIDNMSDEEFYRKFLE